MSECDALMRSYPETTALREDLTLVAKHYNFAIRTQEYFATSGDAVTLLLAFGELCFPFGNDIERVKLELYIPKEYPRVFPYAYVRVAAGKRVVSSPYLHADGQLNFESIGSILPYKILSLFEDLQFVFAKSPPFTTAQYMPNSSSSFSPSSSSSSSLLPPPQSQSQSSSSHYGNSSSSVGGGASNSGVVYYHSSTQQQQQQQPQRPPPQQPQQQQQQQQQQPPPPPPQLQLVYNEIMAQLATRKIAVDKLRVEETELEQRRVAMQQQVPQQTAAIAALENNLTAYRAYLEELHVLALAAPPPPTLDNIDEIVTVGTPLHTQIVELLAEDNAISECLLNLGLSDNLDISTCVRQVRSLSTRQFMVRATLKAARMKAMSSNVPDGMISL